jgi:hypothetical protein
MPYYNNMSNGDNAMKNLTIEQLRVALDHMKRNVELAMEAGDTSLAGAFYDKIDALCIALHQKIDDPCTTLADVRYFEGA